MNNLIKPYKIECTDSDQVKERLLFLISKGMVFTTYRHRTWEVISTKCGDPWRRWC